MDHRHTVPHIFFSLRDLAGRRGVTLFIATSEPWVATEWAVPRVTSYQCLHTRRFPIDLAIIKKRDNTKSIYALKRSRIWVSPE